MAVQGKTLKFINAKGIDTRWKSETGGAEDIANARVDPEGLGWLFDRGLEPWWDPGASFNIVANAATFAAYLGAPIDSCFVWAKQNTDQVYYLIEQSGNLYYFWGNKGTKVGNYYFNDIVSLGSGRHIPSTNDPSTQYIPYGNRLLIINGYDKPVWFYGRGRTRDFSFTLPTGSPETLDVQTDYLIGTDLDAAIAAPSFGENAYIGLGAIDERNNFSWKISNITDSGSESPLSSTAVTDWINGVDVAEEKRFGVFMASVPVGPNGTVARRIYRTKNQKNSNTAGAADSIYYFVRQINDNTTSNFVDVVPDSVLVDEAPTSSDSSVISSAYQHGATWDNRVWLAGGTPHPTRLIYSRQGAPEQFPQGNYFELGNSSGGAITGIYPYYSNLIVFRQRAIELVQHTSTGLSVTTLSPEIGTEASGTIKLVPGFGVCFLGYDNVYVINGGTSGGSAVKINVLSGTVGKELQRLNRSALPRATAVYSHKEQEYWIHYPVDGQNYNTRGMVLHTAIGQWSLRHSITDDDSLFRFQSMTVDPVGNIIIGPRPEWLLAGSTSGPAFTGAAAVLPGVLHVWSGASYWGNTYTASSVSQDTASYTVTPNAKPGIRWESNWIDFQDNSEKYRVFHVEAEILSYGNLDLDLSWAQDYDYSFTSAGTQKQNRPETVNTSSEDPCFGPVSSEGKRFFTIGTDTLQDGRITTLRWDVNTKLMQNFKFKLENALNSPFHLVSFHVTFNTRDQKPLNQRARINPGQPR